MLVEPKDMLKALNKFGFVNLRHLTTRRDNGYIRPVAGVNKGERPKYDMRNALIYCVGAFLESNSFLMAFRSCGKCVVISLRLTCQDISLQPKHEIQEQRKGRNGRGGVS